MDDFEQDSQVVDTHVETYTGVATEPMMGEEVKSNYLTIGEELTDEDRNLVYNRLGRPEDPDKYDLSGIVPDNYDPALLADFKKQAFENGMSNEGVRKMTEWYKNVEMAKAEALNKARAQHSDMQILQLKQEFGTRFDQEVGNARKALDAYTDKDFRKYMDETGLGNHPALVKAFAKIGRELSEDRLVQSETASRLAQDESLKRSEILRLRSDASFMDKYRRGDRAAIERLNRLYEGN